jgi:hypothetical protein
MVPTPSSVSRSRILKREHVVRTRMPIHREEASFTIRIQLSAEFNEAYEGDDDGFAWRERWRANVKPKLVRAVFDALRADPTFEATPITRGLSPDENTEIDVTLRTRSSLPIRS